jgi:hypothetical protein
MLQDTYFVTDWHGKRVRECYKVVRLEPLVREMAQSVQGRLSSGFKDPFGCHELVEQDMVRR